MTQYDCLSFLLSYVTTKRLGQVENRFSTVPLLSDNNAITRVHDVEGGALFSKSIFNVFMTPLKNNR